MLRTSARLLLYNIGMCGRYVITDVDHLKKRFETVNDAPKEVQPNYNAAPTQTLPVVIEEGGERRIELMHWGIIPVWAKDKPRFAFSTFNARGESLLEKPMWKYDFARHRCLVPASGFYEWKKIDKTTKQPYYITVKNTSLFAMAGIYDAWSDEKTGETFTSFTIVTTLPNKDMSPIRDRMPVILDHDEEKAWINSEISTDELMPMVNSYTSGKLVLTPVDKRVGNVRNNDANLVVPEKI